MAAQQNTHAETQAPQQTPVTSGRPEVESVIAELTKMQPAEDGEPADAVESDDVVEVDEEASAPPEEAPKKEKPVSVQIAAIERARREAAAKLDEERRAIADERRKFESERSKYDTDGLRKLFRTNPIAFFREFGLSQSHEELGKQLHSLAQQAYAEALGDKAPPELKEARERYMRDSRINELEQKLENYEKAEQKRRQDEERARAWSDFRSSVRTQLGALPDDLPHLKRLAARRTDDVLDDVSDVIERYHAKTGQVPELDEVFRYLNGKLAALVESSATDEDATKPTTKQKTPRPTAGSKSLSNEITTSTTGRQPDPEDHQERIRQVIEELKQGKANVVTR